MMIINPFAFIPDPQLVAGNTVNGTANTVVWPAGTAQGDVAFLVSMATATLAWTGLTGWTTDYTLLANTGVNVIVYRKVLVAADISSPPSFTNATSGGYSVTTWRGFNAVTPKTSITNTAGATLSVPSFTRNALSAGVMTLIVDRDTSAVTVPTGTTQSYQAAVTIARFGFAFIRGYDDAAMVWGCAATFNQCGASWEFT